MLNVIAFVMAIAGGIAMPLMTLVFGRATNGYNDFAAKKISTEEFEIGVLDLVYYYLYIFAGKLIVSYIATLSINVAAIRTTTAIRQAVFLSILRKHISYFDLPSAGSTASQITSNAIRINKGIGERLVVITQALATLVSAFIISMAVQWKLALITMTALPLIAVVTSVCIRRDMSHEVKVMAAYSKAAKIAEEALSSIRTVHAFWAQDDMLDKYDAYLDEAHKHGDRKSINYGILFSIEFFCVYAAIGLAFWEGYRMFNRGQIQAIGDVMTYVLSFFYISPMLTSNLLSLVLFYQL